ncbi:hypothetical protein K2173_013218 [Erythroxylum novogranatense]|uniref:DUF4094 domain-containing protein n=1 Tax=Erythroxylum novogranatense TaxID=1862640 RepID=A0AAV8SCA3_9ROSI|nr:hypothetical protein K2173_013218 [Erythroxylum novogranatense]
MVSVSMCILLRSGNSLLQQLWVQPESNDQLMSLRRHEQELQVVSEVSAPKKKNSVYSDVMDEVLKTHEVIQ